MRNAIGPSLLLWIFFGLFSTSADAAGDTQKSDCSNCHPAEVKLHDRTRMAHAMLPVLESDFAQNLPEQLLGEPDGGYHFVYRKAQDGLVVTASRGDKRTDGIIKWVLGAGAQGQTPLVLAPNGILESRISYFPQIHRYGITIGQDWGVSGSPVAALGRLQTQHDLQTCIGCHATAITSKLEPVTPGVQCERCHPGAGEHARGNGRPVNPGRFLAREQLQFCGDCHRVKPPVDDAQIENVRFQPLRLMKSRCFDSGKLACTTCHPAHQDARRNDPAFYNARCHSCHDDHLPHADARKLGDCVGCHMPYVRLHPALNFTDHFIRVVKTGDIPPSLVRQRGAGP